MNPRVRPLLACPRCRGRLTDAPDALRCESCSSSYDLSVDGVPVLFPDSSEVAYSTAEAFYAKGRSPIVRVLKKILQPVDLKAQASLHDRWRDEYVYGAPEGTLILNLGSGTDLILQDRRFINFDIYPHANTDVVGDGHHLPFLDASFDVVWLSAVLEHVRKPWLVADEAFRVLRPGGAILVSVPFIQTGHAAPHDYFRYTADGLRSVFDRFEEVEAGPSFTGPTGTMIHVVASWMSAIVPGKLGFALEALVTRLLFPLKYADRVVSRRGRGGQILTGGSCYLGRRPE